MCTKQVAKKYVVDRPSPPYPAQECPDTKKKGNNGKMWVSVANSRGVYQWKPVVGKASSRSPRKRRSLSSKSKRSSRSPSRAKRPYRKRSSRSSSRTKRPYRKRSSRSPSSKSRRSPSSKSRRSPSSKYNEFRKITMKVGGEIYKGGSDCSISTSHGYMYITRPKSWMRAVFTQGSQVKFSLNDKRKTLTTGSTVITFDRPVDYKKVVNDLQAFATKHIQ